MKYQVKKTLLGYSVKYKCAKCQAGFTASLNDAGTQELCECGQRYIIPGVAEKEKLKALKAAKQREAEKQKRDADERKLAKKKALEGLREKSTETEESDGPLPPPPPKPFAPFAVAPPGRVSASPEIRKSRGYKRNEYPALTVVRIVLLVIACLAVGQWVLVSVVAAASAIKTIASDGSVDELPESLRGRSMFDEELTDEQREIISNHDTMEMKTAMRGGMIMFGVLGWAVNTVVTAVFTCLVVAFSELIKLMIDIQDNTQHTAANS